MEDDAPSVPQDLKACPPAALEEYVRARILHFTRLPALTKALALSPGALDAASQAILAAHPLPGAEGGGAPDLALAFTHDCQHLGCPDVHCQLCSQNQSRKCGRTLCPKYLSGDTLRAGCGAVIRAELVDKGTGRHVAPPGALRDARIQLTVLDGKGYEGLKGAAPSEADIQRLTLKHNQQGGPLLTSKAAQAGSAADAKEGRVVAPLGQAGSVLLPDLIVTGSSEAMLSGQKPPFLLLGRLVDPQGRPVATVKPALSEGFVVATPRVRTAAKKEIPHVDDDVSKINAVGNATQCKLRDLVRAAKEAGMQGLGLPLARVNKAGELRQLVLWAEEDGERREKVKRLLKLTKGWEEARDHVLKAVTTDNRLRIWYASDALDRGLLYGCSAANPRLDAPLASLLRVSTPSGQITLQATVLDASGASMATGSQQAAGAAAGPELSAQEVRSMHQRAVACWGRRGHPGWALVQMETAAFEQMCGHLPCCLLPPALAAAALPQAPHRGFASAAPPTPLLQQRQQQQAAEAAAAAAGTQQQPGSPAGSGGAAAVMAAPAGSPDSPPSGGGGSRGRAGRGGSTVSKPQRRQQQQRQQKQSHEDGGLGGSQRSQQGQEQAAQQKQPQQLQGQQLQQRSGHGQGQAQVQATQALTSVSAPEAGLALASPFVKVMALPTAAAEGRGPAAAPHALPGVLPGWPLSAAQALPAGNQQQQQQQQEQPLGLGMISAAGEISLSVRPSPFASNSSKSLPTAAEIRAFGAQEAAAARAVETAAAAAAGPGAESALPAAKRQRVGAPAGRPGPAAGLAGAFGISPGGTAAAAGAADAAKAAECFAGFPSVPSPLLFGVLSGLPSLPPLAQLGLEAEPAEPAAGAAGLDGRATAGSGSASAAAAGLSGSQALSPLQSLRDVFAGPSMGSVDWKQMLKDAYFSDAPAPDAALPPSSSSPAPSPSVGGYGPIVSLPATCRPAPAPPAAAPPSPSPDGTSAPTPSQQPSSEAAAAAAATAGAVRAPPAPPPLFRHTSSLGELGMLGTLPGGLDSLLKDQSLGDLTALLANTVPGGSSDPGSTSRQLHRMLTPEWARLFSFKMEDLDFGPPSSRLDRPPSPLTAALGQREQPMLAAAMAAAAAAAAEPLPAAEQQQGVEQPREPGPGACWDAAEAAGGSASGQVDREHTV